LARVTLPSPAQPQLDEPKRPNEVGVFIISCIPLAAIIAILFAAGGTSPGFLIPAITCGVVIGFLVFMAFWDGPPR
jgi:hypothetical protein